MLSRLEGNLKKLASNEFVKKQEYSVQEVMSCAEKPDIGSFLVEARFSDGVEVSTCHNYVELELSEARFDR